MKIHSLRRGVAILGAALLCTATTSGLGATIIVTNTADSGSGSLRGALASAGNGDTIDATGVSGTILLTSGQLVVSKSVTILGPGPGSLAVNGNYPATTNRVFHITSDLVVTISGLTITGGSAPGPAPNNYGGGIYHEGRSDTAKLMLFNCVVSNNSARWGGGIYHEGFSGNSTMTLANCTVISNRASSVAAGIYNDHATMTVTNCTISGNSGRSVGGIYSDGYGDIGSTVAATLSVLNSTISGNSDTNGGGGIYSDGSNTNGSATLTVTNCTVSGNWSSGDGGGIINDGGYNGNGMLMLVNSTVSSNSASGAAGIFNTGGNSGSATATVLNSTVSGNWVTDSNAGGGGGLYNTGIGSGSATLTVLNSTLSSNSAVYGGGVWNDGSYSGSGTLMVLNSTFSGNAASFQGGGIYNGGAQLSNATVKVGSTILKAGALGANIFKAAGATVTSFGYNLSSDNGGGWLTNTADQINTEPMLGPLQNNGGPTLTHALLGGSPALDKGKNLSSSSTDQRGFPRIADLCPTNAVGGDGTDIGAIELPGSFAVGTITVDNLNDSGAGSLRNAIFLAGICPDTNTIVFAPSAYGTISLTSGELLITSPLSILGPGPTNVIINGNGSNRVFRIAPANTATIAGLTITNGLAANSLGGGIDNDHSILTVSNCTISGNAVSGIAGSGGGIANDGSSGSASLTVIASTLRGNHGGSSLGGAILNDGESGGNATLTVISSTLSGNSAAAGGAIYNLAQGSGTGSISVRASTFSGNSALSRGGAIYNDGQFCTAALISINASTFSGNTANDGGTIFNESSFTINAKVQLGDTILNAGASGANIVNNQGDASNIITYGYNLSSDNAGGFLTNSTDQINTNPQLGPLQNNGGPTFTHALLTNSPAIDKGKRDAVANLVSNTDQRSLPRPADLPDVANAPGGDGSDIGAFEVQAAVFGTPMVLAGLQKLLNGPFQFSFSNTPGASFTVLTSTNIELPLSNWTVLGPLTEISPGYFQFADPQATNHAQGFYRVRSP